MKNIVLTTRVMRIKYSNNTVGKVSTIKKPSRGCQKVKEVIKKGNI